MNFKKREPDELVRRRAEILAEYKFYNMQPMRIAGEPISIELAVQIGLIVDTSQAAAE